MHVGRATAQAVSRWSLSAAAWVRNKASPCGISWWKLRLQDGVFSEYFGYPPTIIPQPVLHNHSFIHHRRYIISVIESIVNPLNAKLNLICHLLALLGIRPVLHVSGVRVD